MNKQRVLNTCIDCVSKFRASKYPLRNIASDLIKARKLNSRERAYFLDVVFAWARESKLILNYLQQQIRFFSGLSHQERDLLALKLLSQDENSAERQKYNSFVKSLGDERYSMALGELIHNELVKSHGEAAKLIAKSSWQSPAKYLAFDTNFMSMSQVQIELAKIGVKVEPYDINLAPTALKIIEGKLTLSRLPKNLSDSIWFMDAGSQIIANLIKPKVGDRVLDLCVGEGNKARLLAMKDCEIIALDIDAERLEKAKKRLQNFRNIKFICADGTKAPLEPESFDYILLDAPCSGSGVMRRNPDLVHRLSEKQLISYQKIQRDLLTSAIRLLRPSGTLIYATCSLFASENQQQIAQILSKNAHVLVTQLGDLHKNSLELMPHINDCDGFYVAGLTKS
jgi:16S rRNA (cytosine967-C5)-methyltransferase